LPERYPHQHDAERQEQATEDPVHLLVLEVGEREGGTANENEEVAIGSAPTATAGIPRVFQKLLPIRIVLDGDLRG
jgi:hypothetical protein